MSDTFADVHVAYPIDPAFTYRVPEGMELKTGCRITVPFGNRDIVGYTVSVHRQKPNDFEVKDVLSLIDDEPIFDEKLIDLCRFTAESYCSYIGESLAMALPSGKKASGKGSDKISAANYAGRRGALIQEQRLVADKISESTGRGSLVHCLFGVTGSGKTEIYIEMAERIIAAGKSVIYLVPEISLSSQIYERLYSVFGSELTMYHSALTPNQRLHSWQKIYTGKSRIAVGTRSAVFLQPPDLGLIIIDEEHDASFKERSAPRYNARRLAMYRSRKEGATLIVGSATPAVETLHAAKEGLIELHRLSVRYGGASLPSIEIIKSTAKSQTDNIISPMLKMKTKQAIDSGNQVIYFLNRRGFAPIVLCDKCSEILQCPDCSISLNLHKDGVMLCHYCGYKMKMPASCPKCGVSPLLALGAGTQRVEDIVAKTFPASKVRRLDQDSSRKKGSVFDIIDGMINGEIDILLGTQMVAKGFDFPGVSVVGVLMADIGLNIPDFRSAERIFSLLVQVAGRSGRGDKPGVVFIQTNDPEHPVFKFIKSHDYESFYHDELDVRKSLRYPPFSRLVRLLVRGVDEKLVEEGMRMVAASLIKAIGSIDKNVLLLGPVAAPIEKIGGNYRHHIILKGADIAAMRRIIRSVRDEVNLGKKLYLEIDIDPIDML